MKPAIRTLARCVAGFAAMLIISTLWQWFIGDEWGAGFWSGAFACAVSSWMLRPMDELWPKQEGSERPQ